MMQDVENGELGTKPLHLSGILNQMQNSAHFALACRYSEGHMKDLLQLLSCE